MPLHEGSCGDVGVVEHFFTLSPANEMNSVSNNIDQKEGYGPVCTEGAGRDATMVILRLLPTKLQAACSVAVSLGLQIQHQQLPDLMMHRGVLGGTLWV